MNLKLEDLFEAGCHLGHPAQKWHPQMKPWIYGEQDGIHLFDLEKTLLQIEKAEEYLQNLRAVGKTVVVVATKKQAAELAEKLAKENGAMYIINRWPGGLLTNWEQVRRSIKRMNEIEAGLKGGDKFKDYTKYEKIMLEKELVRLERLFGGLKELRAKPDVLLVVDAWKEKNAVKEALSEKVDVVALIDSNTDPTGILLPVPMNDDALSSIQLVLSDLLAAYGKRGKTTVVEPEVKAEVKETKPEVKEVKEVKLEKEAKPKAKETKPAVKEAKEITTDKTEKKSEKVVKKTVTKKEKEA